MGFRITLREAIFSITIASIFFIIGFFISSAIEHYENSKNLEYRQAAQIIHQEEFKQGMKTDIGNAFVEGDFRTIDKVSHPKLDGEWLWIRSSYQEYRMHTRVVHYTTGSGNNKQHHSRVEHYWTWDTYKTEFKHAKTVEFCGNSFNYFKFDYSNVRKRYDFVNNGYNRRIIFYSMYPDFHATVYSNLSNNTISKDTVLRCGKTIDEIYDEMTTSYGTTIFWIIWSIVGISTIIWFVYNENDWIEDD